MIAARSGLARALRFLPVAKMDTASFEPHGPASTGFSEGPVEGPGDEALAWIAIRTKSRHEASVRDQLARKDIVAFLPTIPRWSRWKDRRKLIDWPLFQGYCFARPRPEQFRSVQLCAGVAGVVSFDGRAATIPDEEIDAIRALVMSDLQYDPCPLLSEGSLVEVVSGALKGVDRPARAQRRARAAGAEPSA